MISGNLIIFSLIKITLICPKYIFEVKTKIFVQNYNFSKKDKVDKP